MPKFIFEQAIDGIEAANKNVFYLSINNPDDKDKTPIRPDSENYKSMWFYDLHETVGDHEVISEDQLDEMYDFIMANSDKDYFVVHCTAGVSRSGAVGEFVNDIFGIPYSEFKRLNPQIVPNVVIKQGLNKRYNERR